MNVFIDITENLKDQFESSFNLKESGDLFTMDPAIGTGSMRYLELPNQLVFYHFKQTQFRVGIDMTSVNPIGTEWYLIHINLGLIKQQKTIQQDERIDFHRDLPCGILLYGPGLEIHTNIPPNSDVELASIHFHRSFVESYFDSIRSVIDLSKNIIYEDLDYKLENTLTKALSSMDHKMQCHARVLDFLQQFFDKLKLHAQGRSHENLHADDVKRLFKSATYLRNPIAPKTPSLSELAAIANMSTTKFKTSFKQVFGSAPFSYRHKIRMEFARDQIQSKRKSPVEISYALGYSHPSNFTAAYKKFFDALPSEH